MDAPNQPLNLMIVIASTRPTRVGGSIGRWVASVADEHPEFRVTVADLREIDLPLMNEPKHPRLQQYVHDHTKQWSALVAEQDAFVFISPEYNHGMVAPLKNAIDYLVQEWAYKPVGIVSYGGISTGLRAVQQIRQILPVLKMVPVPEAVTIPNIGQNRDDDGSYVPNDSATEAAHAMLTSVWRWAVALRGLRTGDIPSEPPVAALAGANGKS